MFFCCVWFECFLLYFINCCVCWQGIVCRNLPCERFTEIYWIKINLHFLHSFNQYTLILIMHGLGVLKFKFNFHKFIKDIFTIRFITFIQRFIFSFNYDNRRSKFRFTYEYVYSSISVVFILSFRFKPNGFVCGLLDLTPLWHSCCSELWTLQV